MLSGADLVPTISVVVNNYNYARYLRDALDAALAQIGEGDEIVVVDDGSTDDSPAVLADYADRPGIRVVRQENQGQLRTVLNGLAAARGELIALLDSDDVFLPGYLERLRERAAKSPTATFFFSRACPEGQDAAAVSAMARCLDRMRYAEGACGDTHCAAIMFGEYLGSPTTGLALRAALAQELLRRCEGMPADVSYGNNLSADGLIVRLVSALGERKYSIAEDGFRYRIHGHNAFAGLPRRARFKLRFQRVFDTTSLVAKIAGVSRRPALAALVREAHSRATPLHRRRRVVLACQYGLGTLFARGPLLSKCLKLPLITAAMLRFRSVERPVEP